MATMLILGATSDIARASALAFAREGWDLHLAGRDELALSKIAKDLAVRTGRTAAFSRFDAARPEEHQAFWDNLAPHIQAVLCAVGLLVPQGEAQNDVALAASVIQTNFTGPASVLALIANSFEERGQGLIIGISSVAGDRGRASNYVYGSAKAGFSAFLSGLRNRLASRGVHVMTVKPGFVATAMTEGLDLPAALTASADEVAADIVRGVRKKRNIIHSKWFWKIIMLVITHIPERFFKKMRL